ncbi:hypothetical protein AADW59_00810 [Candidatus Hodgkinia cicadicola]
MIANDTGLIKRFLPNSLFRVKLDNKEEVTAGIAAKDRLMRTKILVGDRVRIKRTAGSKTHRIIHKYTA